MRREMRWIKTTRDRRRSLQKHLLIARDHAQLRQTRDRTLVFLDRLVGMRPWIEPRRRLRQTSEINRFRQIEIARGFSKIAARGGFGAETAIAVTAAI